MKQFINFITICLLLAGLSGCATFTNNDPTSQSVFWESFSIGTIIENNEGYLLPGSRQGFGSESGSSDQPFMQKQEEITLQIEEADLSAFLAAVQSGIDNAIVESGANIAGRGSGGLTGTSFSISYRENDIYGVVNVWGAHGEGTAYYLLVIITEGLEKTEK